MDAIIKVQGLRKEYKSRDTALEVLNVPSLVLEKGKKVVLAGHSGSGKTTFLNIIAGLTLPTQGSVFINNQSIYQLGEPERDLFRSLNMGYIFQNFNLVPSLTALENVILPMFFAGGKSRSKQVNFARELLARVQLENRYHHKPGELSRGEQQRVAVARSLANKASLILADEPTGSVDLKNAKIILSLIRDLCQEYEASLLLVSHNSYVADSFPELWDMAEINKAAIMQERGVE